MGNRNDRVLRLDGVHNFRDFGGYPLPGGGRVRRGVLWRSGQHAEASDADLARIAALDLAAVFDLRSSVERDAQPCRRPQGFAARLFVSADALPAGGGPAGGGPAGGGQANGGDGSRAAPHVAAAARPSGTARDAASVRATLRRSYETLPFRSGLVAMMRQYLEELSRLEGASLINCMAGKDRTGIAVAVLLSALGAHRDDIMDDYLLTNTAGDAAARMAAGQRSIRGIVGDLEPDALVAMMGVEAAYLDTAFAAIAERYGGMEAYLAEVLGVDEALRERLRARLAE